MQTLLAGLYSVIGSAIRGHPPIQQTYIKLSSARCCLRQVPLHATEASHNPIKEAVGLPFVSHEVEAERFSNVAHLDPIHDKPDGAN